MKNKFDLVMRIIGFIFIEIKDEESLIDETLKTLRNFKKEPNSILRHLNSIMNYLVGGIVEDFFE